MLSNRIRNRLGVFFILSFSLAVIFHSGTPKGNKTPYQTKLQPNFQDNHGLPVSLIENRGQIDSRVLYYVQDPGRSVFFTKEGYTLRISQKKNEVKSHSVKVELADAATERVESLQQSAATVGYFKGLRKNWKTVAVHSKIGYVRPWPGIDVAYDGSSGKIESIYTVAPYADPNRIRLRYTGQDSLHLDENGNLVYSTSVGEIMETAPVAWQVINGQHQSVETSFQILSDNTVGFQVAAYDQEYALTIDPTLTYATYIGGGGSEDGQDMALDSVGNVYITGPTTSTDFPVAVGPDTSYNGGSQDIFVAKLNPTGTSLLYAGYIGGSGYDSGVSIAVDNAGNAFVAGVTSSTDFPVIVGPDLTFNSPADGTRDAFVTKINSAGTALIYSGYIGGSGDDASYGVDVDSSSNAYLTGYTFSSQSSFPVTLGPDTTHNGGEDAFIAKVNSSGSALVYAGYIGGDSADTGWGIAVDNAGNAYVGGSTGSGEGSFPVVVGPDLTYNGIRDAFVTKVTPSGSSLVYSGYVGGAGLDEGWGMAVDGLGGVYVTGRTRSLEDTFPVNVGPDLTFNGPTGGFDGYIAKINPSGAGLSYAGYIGGVEDDRGFGVAVDGIGNAYVIGVTSSAENTFPVIIGPDTSYNGGNGDAFVAKVNPVGNRLEHAGYIGGGGSENGRKIAVDDSGGVYLVGITDSSSDTFPDGDGFGSIPGFDQTRNGFDAWVVKASLISPTLFDFDFDGKADISVFRPSNSTWYLRQPSGTYTQSTFGTPGDMIAPADYDADGKADICVFRPSEGKWYMIRSQSQTFAEHSWGANGDLPVPADHNNDGRSDLVVFRGSNNTFYMSSVVSGPFASTQFGAAGDKPLVGDFDGDWKADVAVYRPSNNNWYILKSSVGYFVQTWGESGDIPVPADYDGDGTTDIAVFRPSTGTWYAVGTKVGWIITVWGEAGDIPVPADYDGDRKADPAVFRPSNLNWYLLRSTAGAFQVPFGATNDLPIQSAFVY